MSLDFAALAGSLAVGVPGVRACLFVSKDGLALAAHPASEEASALAAWARLLDMGPMERGFIAMDHENWLFSRRTDYAGFVRGLHAYRRMTLSADVEAVEAYSMAAGSRLRRDPQGVVRALLPVAPAVTGG